LKGCIDGFWPKAATAVVAYLGVTGFLPKTAFLLPNAVQMRLGDLPHG
jgi:hypothetical protein